MIVVWTAAAQTRTLWKGAERVFVISGHVAGPPPPEYGFMLFSDRLQTVFRPSNTGEPTRNKRVDQISVLEQCFQTGSAPVFSDRFQTLFSDPFSDPVFRPRFQTACPRKPFSHQGKIQ